MFVHLRGRWTYSMLEWIGSHNHIFQKAKDLEQSAIALTDLYGIYGVVDFYIKAKNFEINAIIWVELPYTPFFSLLPKTKWVIKTLWTLTFLVKDAIWYHNLLRLVSTAYNQSIDDIPCLDSQILKQYSEWLIVLVGWMHSYISTALAKDDITEAKALFTQLSEIFDPEDIVLDITAQPYEIYPTLSLLNNWLIEQWKTNGYTMVTTSDYHYPEASQKKAYETALAIKDGKKTYESDARKVLWEHHILSEQDVRNILEKNKISDDLIQSLIDNTVTVADRCHAKITLWQALFPNYETPEHIKELYELHKDNMVE